MEQRAEWNRGRGRGKKHSSPVSLLLYRERRERGGRGGRNLGGSEHSQLLLFSQRENILLVLPLQLHEKAGMKGWVGRNAVEGKEKK